MSIENNNDSNSSSLSPPPSPQLQDEQNQHVNTTTTTNNNTNNNNKPQKKEKEEEEEEEDYNLVPFTKFEDLGLPDELLRGLFSFGFEKPSQLQQLGIKPIMEGRDVVVQGQAGTGKTAAYLVGVFSRVDGSLFGCQALILAPTRELATQITHLADSLATFSKIRTTKCVGGTSFREQKDSLQDGVHVVVGTPGRLLDLIHRKLIILEELRVLVMELVDEMLSMGFRYEIFDIFDCLPEGVQVVLVSSTMPAQVREITEKFMRKPVHVFTKIGHDKTLDGIQQFYVNVEQEKWKFDTLCDLYDVIKSHASLIFCNTRRKVLDLSEKLTEKNFEVSAIYSGMESKERNEIMKLFKPGSKRILISNDILAAGIDLPLSLSLVINYDLPQNFESYFHRIGRSGRFGRKGMAISFVTKEENNHFRDLERFYDVKIEELNEKGLDFDF